jgi:adenine-specific DNA-methyltransferase
MTAASVAADSAATSAALVRAVQFPRLRYMGSKYKLLPHLARVFSEIGGTTALDAFSGSGVVSYLLKAQGYQVTSNDFLQFPAAITRATVVNQATILSPGDIDRICGPAADKRDFIQKKFGGIFYAPADLEFFDRAWSHIDTMTGHKRALAISALVLAAARKQPRGVFTFTGNRYDDGRRDLHISMEQHFRERAAEYNAVVFNNHVRNRSQSMDIVDVDPRGYDLVYLDPPYAPPSDDADYIKRYHFLEGLACYWRGQVIMENTITKKIAKKYTPFAYKRSIVEALRSTFKQFNESAIVLSYSSNALPHVDVIEGLLREAKDDVEVVRIDHRYSFGTHVAAERRSVSEYLFIGR